MGAPSSAASYGGTRLKREDFRRTKHDSAFSQWKILIGPSDWEDHSRGKEGAEKYRTQNLPNWTCCPGVYELGVAALRPGSRRRAHKLESSIVVPVYVGQADNLRIRLQQYGRDGAHLENRCLNHKSTDHQTSSPHKGLGLFTDIFSRGFPILYRCAPTESKKDAETTERQLLDKFDYAWNKGSNGPRRPYDIHRKLDHLLEQSQISLLAKKFIFFYKKPVGIKIKTCEPCLSKKGPDLSSADNITIFSRIFRSKRLQPGPRVQYGDHGSTDICGVAIGQGSVCRIPPVEGRKRCALHKGMRVNGSLLKLNNERKVVHPPVGGSVDFQHHFFGPICGFIMENGAPCREEPFLRNKRCLEHKGRRIRKS